jgi:DNA mismatch repair protein MutL
MSSIIKILSDSVINKIAAGEVVERPASVVKELIENSLDAGASDIAIDIEQAGRRRIRVTDDGCGMTEEDARTSFLRHATSKLTDDADLEAVRTMGFRGEALSSIASVSQVRLLTALKGAPSGTLVELEGGAIKSVTDAAAASGTTIEISHLFYNTPARLKFLKSAATEFSQIATAVSRQAMANPSVRFKLTHNQKPLFNLPPTTTVEERAANLYGNEIAENLLELDGGRDGIRVHGLIGRPGYTRADRTYQDFYVNRRAVKNTSLSHALYAAYGDMLMRDRHPVGFIFIELDPALVDVNVHPAKTEVRFRNQAQLHDLVRDEVREGLRAHGQPGQGGPYAVGTSAQAFYADRVKEALTDFGDRISEPALQISHMHHSQEEYFDTHSEIRLPQASPLFPLAQIHDSFIIAQAREGMAIVDQHAAHERVLFEKLQHQAKSGTMPVQNLLLPLQVELGPAQGNLLSEYLPELVKIGFIVEDFGNHDFVIKAVPALVVGADYKKMLLDILDEVNIHGTSRRMDGLRDGILSVMACHPAIKIHRRLDRKEMEMLLAELFQCRMPHTCPHGRPTIIRFSMDELKKMFKRM